MNFSDACVIFIIVMSDSHRTDNKCLSTRVQFPDDESKFRWMPMLLDAYAIVDEGIAIAISEEEDKRNIKLSCKKGCDNCCRTHKDIPVYPLELVGIYWFSTEKIVQPAREILKRQLASHAKGDSCPFLINSSCSIHLMRPIACRQFNVFSIQCDEGEDPFYTRRDDVLTPIKDYAEQAFYAMLPFYGVTDEDDKIDAIENNLIHSLVRILQSCNWKELDRIMTDFDAKRH
ncbi:MAG: YkgJ family cysteine cluster protein [Nitrospirota bacterium]